MKYLTTFSLLFLAGGALAYPCPDRLKTTQTPAEKVAGWEPLTDSPSQSLLEMVDFYDGPPSEKAQLIPDNGDSKHDPVWTFTPHEGQKATEIWQVCGYTNTTVSLTRKLPTGTKKCRVKTSKKVSPQIDSITCD